MRDSLRSSACPRLPLWTLLALVVPATSARADCLEWPLRLELGGFGGWNLLSSELELGNAFFDDQVPQSAPLVGVRASYELLRWTHIWRKPVLVAELEGKMSFSKLDGSGDGARPDSASPVFGWRAHAMARAEAWRNLEAFVLAGGGGETVATSSDYVDSPDTDAAFHWGAGVRYVFGPHLSARLDFRQVITAGRYDLVSLNHELHLGIGYSFEIGSQSSGRADRDMDGLPNHADACPDEPEDRDGFQDEDGCPEPDNDGDSIPDNLDKCPDQPEIKNGVDDDDGCPETDEDGDLVIGSLDQCPDQPENKNGFEDDDGCPETDGDGDGIPDGADRCASEAETVNGFEDLDGCPDILPQQAARLSGVVEGVGFRGRTAQLLESSNVVLDAVADALRGTGPRVRVEISGHLAFGGPKASRKLSLARAEAVKTYLVDRGIDGGRLEVVGYGIDKPLSAGRRPKARRTNERIELRLLGRAAKWTPSPKTEPPKTEPPKTEPPKAEPPKTEPPKTEPPKTEPPKTEPDVEPTPDWARDPAKD